MDKIFCDVLISGAGIIGSSLALYLVQSGFQVIIIDSIESIILSNDSHPDSRVSAINFFSIQLLKKIDIWEKIHSSFYTTFKKLEVWENFSSKVIFESSLLNLPYMGIVIENKRLQYALWKNFSDFTQLEFYHPCYLISMQYNGEYWELKLSNQKIINSLLLIGADGINSLVRKQARIRVTGWKYRQSCMALSVTYTKNQKSTVWQIFTPSGPRGFLPLYDHWGSLMWYDNINYIHKLQLLSNRFLEKKIQEDFSDRLGTVKIHRNICFSLLGQYAHEYVKRGLVLIGDAAHTINPLAGQGINLGLRDVDVLVHILSVAKSYGNNWARLETLKHYQKIRWPDNFSMQMGIDCLYVIFSNNIVPMRWIRNASFEFVEKNALFKKYILKYALGY